MTALSPPCHQIQPRSLALVVLGGQGALAALEVRWAQEGQLSPFLLGVLLVPFLLCCPWVLAGQGGQGHPHHPALLWAPAAQPPHLFLEDPEDPLAPGAQGSRPCPAVQVVLAGLCSSSQNVLAPLANRARQVALGDQAGLVDPAGSPGHRRSQSPPCQ